MSRTYAGFLFKCKVCGEVHLLDFGVPHARIRVPCVKDKDAVKKYNKKDFEYWWGSYWDVHDILVNEAK